MYTDKDTSGNISIMKISKEEAQDIGTILLEFEQSIKNCEMSDSERNRLSAFSSKLRFQLINILTQD